MKPILCLDFDGVLHSYASGWKGAYVIPDPPVDGAIDALLRYLESFRVCVHSSRFNAANSPDNSSAFTPKTAVARWLRRHGIPDDIPIYSAEDAPPGDDGITLVCTKPPALVTIDDRALTFNGVWPESATLLAFKPWNKQTI